MYIVVTADGKPVCDAYGNVVLYADTVDAAREKGPTDTIKRVVKYDRRHNPKPKKESK